MLYILPTRPLTNTFLSLRVSEYITRAKTPRLLVRPANWSPKYWTIGQENLAAYIFLGYRRPQRHQCPISSTKVVCIEVMSSVFVTGLQGTCCCRCCSLVACPSAHQRWSTIFAERKGPAARRVCAYRPVPPGAAGRCFVWPLQCICSQSYASRASLHLAHPGATAGAPFERNERDRQACGYARIVRYHQELHPGSLVAVWVLVRAKLWCVVCVVWERGARAPTQDPLEVVEGSEHAGVCRATNIARRCRQVVWWP